MSFLAAAILSLLCLHHVEAKFIGNTCGRLTTGRGRATAAYDGSGFIYFIGGKGNGNPYQRDVVQYSTATQEATTSGTFFYGSQTGSAATTGNGEVYYFGGYGGTMDGWPGLQDEIYKINPQDQSEPEFVGRLPRAMDQTGAAAIGNHSIYIFGGRAQNETGTDYLRDIFHYDIQLDRVRVVGQLPYPMRSCDPVSDGVDKIYLLCETRDTNTINRAIHKFSASTLQTELLEATFEGDRYPVATAYTGKGSSIVLSMDSNDNIHFSKFNFATEKLEDLIVDADFGIVRNPTAVYVPQTDTFYVQGSMDNDYYSDAVFCVNFAEASVVCPSEGLEFIAHPSNCSKYYICSEGTAFEEECAEGLLFDPELGACNIAELVNCETQAVCPSETGISYLHVVGDCTKYILCVSGVGTELDCAPGTEFNPVLDQCVLDDEYSCPYSLKKSL